MAAETAWRSEHARAKVNLTLRVLGRREDGYHRLHSLVAFAGAGDRLDFMPGPTLDLATTGEGTDSLGPPDKNLVTRAALRLAERVEGLRMGRFLLHKTLPVASGIGGGSADAAAALRLLASENGLSHNDRRLQEAALATGADVPVCLAGIARVMAGIGEVLGPPVALPPLPAILVNPRVPVETRAVFARLGLSAGESVVTGAEDPPPAQAFEAFVAWLASSDNDLTRPAIAVAPAIGSALEDVTGLPDCRLARMSGSGATVFGVFATAAAARDAAERLARTRPGWWIVATELS